MCAFQNSLKANIGWIAYCIDKTGKISHMEIFRFFFYKKKKCYELHFEIQINNPNKNNMLFAIS